MTRAGDLATTTDWTARAAVDLGQNPAELKPQPLPVSG